MTGSSWLGVLSGVCLISSTGSALVGYRRFSRRLADTHIDAVVENAMEKLRTRVSGPRPRSGSLVHPWETEADRHVRLIFEAIAIALPDAFAYTAIILAGVGATLGLVALLISN
jgi:hypothetical protein